MKTNRALRLLSTSIGRKLVMAATGMGLIGFVIMHLLGNLTVFKGAQAYNDYAYFLQGLGPTLWLARGGLLVMFLVHMYFGIRLWLGNRAARPQGYAHTQHTASSSFAGRHMLATGGLVLAFVVFHLLHFTFGVMEGSDTHFVDAEGRHDVYGMVTSGLRDPAYATAYIFAMLVLGLHLMHGATSFIQTLGLNHETYSGPLRRGAMVLVGLIVAGNCLIPISALAGWIGNGGGH